MFTESISSKVTNKLSKERYEKFSCINYSKDVTRLVDYTSKQDFYEGFTEKKWV